MTEVQVRGYRCALPVMTNQEFSAIQNAMQVLSATAPFVGSHVRADSLTSVRFARSRHLTVEVVATHFGTKRNVIRTTPRDVNKTGLCSIQSVSRVSMLSVAAFVVRIVLKASAIQVPVAQSHRMAAVFLAICNALMDWKRVVYFVTRVAKVDLRVPQTCVIRHALWLKRPNVAQGARKTNCLAHSQPLTWLSRRS
jgi:hypothetical protein